MAIKQAKLLHVVAIPYPAQGHINPMLQLCEQLVPRGFTFTFINTLHIHQRLLHSGHITRPCGALNGEYHLHDAVVHDVHQHGQTAQVDSQKEMHNLHHIHLEDDYVHALDTYNGDDTRAQQVHHYKGCSSIKMVFVAGGCAPEKHAHISTAPEAFKAAQEMCKPVENLLSCIMEGQAINFIMSDIVLGWSSATAHKFGLPWFSFWPASAASLSAFIYFSDLANQGKASIPIAEMEAEEGFLIDGIPGLPPTLLSDVPKIWDDKGKLYEEILSYFKELGHASLVLLNTFEELEAQVLQALSKRFPILPVGPLLPSRYMLHTCPDSQQNGPLYRPSLFPEDTRCLAWLDSHPPSSVLFISFGSISLRSPAQLQELAQGLVASGCPFLWVCKPDASHEPDNNRFFTPENGRPPRGFIVPWAPQLQVLSHPSVGGFITHCGWNSVIESASMGVPMLCWADTTERMSSQRFVVEFWKCGIDMVADTRRTKQHIDEAMLVGRDDVEKSVRFLMLEEGGASVRFHAAKLRRAAIKAYKDSHARLNEFTQNMKQRCLHSLSKQRRFGTLDERIEKLSAKKSSCPEKVVELESLSRKKEFLINADLSLVLKLQYL